MHSSEKPAVRSQQCTLQLLDYLFSRCDQLLSLSPELCHMCTPTPCSVIIEAGGVRFTDHVPEGTQPSTAASQRGNTTVHSTPTNSSQKHMCIPSQRPLHQPCSAAQVFEQDLCPGVTLKQLPSGRHYLFLRPWCCCRLLSQSVCRCSDTAVGVTPVNSSPRKC